MIDVGGLLCVEEDRWPGDAWAAGPAPAAPSADLMSLRCDRRHRDGGLCFERVGAAATEP